MAEMRQLIRRLGLAADGAFHPAVALGRSGVLLYLSTFPFGHNAALKNLAMLLMLAALGWLAARRRLPVDWRSPVLLGVGGLVLAFALTSAVGIEPADSFDELRKQFLPGLLGLLLIPALFGEAGQLRLLLGVLAGAFLLRAGLTFGELLHYFPDLDAGRAEGAFIKGFSLDAGFYIPVILALWLLGGRWRWLAPAGLLLVLADMLLAQSRTPLVAAALGGVLMLVVLRRWRVLVVLCVLAAVGIGGMLLKQPQLAERLGSTFNPATYAQAFDTRNYRGNDGLAARMPIWAGVLEIGAARPWTGYGFGWKKLATVAVDAGYVARWGRIEHDAFAAEQAAYFAQPASTVNPHNLYLQLYFESGVLGLLAYGGLVFILAWQAWRLIGRRQVLPGVIGGLLLAYLADHLVLGLSNGLPIGLGPSLALVALLETARRHEGKA
ncbi:MAG: O-antigen ligase domain-containing protein [Rhodocyclales bacterium GT-UBC]|nr:MAG: O-antigen ligase domain-containing protein [Rhodocyclales bacterium GT-UBC]